MSERCYMNYVQYSLAAKMIYKDELFRGYKLIFSEKYRQAAILYIQIMQYKRYMLAILRTYHYTILQG
jgi:hypothetical protein